VAKPELGTKRQCGGCGAKFYDLGKDPITCPKCGTVFEVVAIAPRSRPPEAAAAATTAAARAAAPAEETLVPETQDAEFVSLEEADAEAQGAKKPEAETTDVDEDVELDESLDDAAFIEEQEEEDADVTDIIGDVADEEET
jgi:uncharacterized protein (TIGR02300 family)